MHFFKINKNLLYISPQYGELRPTSGWDHLVSLGHPCKFQRVSRPGSVTAWHSSSGCQPNFASLNRGSHLYSAGRPSRWALAHISSCHLLFIKWVSVCLILMQQLQWRICLLLCVFAASSLRSETVNALRPCAEAAVRDDYSEDDITLDPLIVLRCDTRVFRSVTCNSPTYIEVLHYTNYRVIDDWLLVRYSQSAKLLYVGPS